MQNIQDVAFYPMKNGAIELKYMNEEAAYNYATATFETEE